MLFSIIWGILMTGYIIGIRPHIHPSVADDFVFFGVCAILAKILERTGVLIWICSNEERFQAWRKSEDRKILNSNDKRRHGKVW